MMSFSRRVSGHHPDLKLPLTNGRTWQSSRRRFRLSPGAFIAIALTIATSLSACGQPPEGEQMAEISPAATVPPAPGVPKCAPIAGDDLQILVDDLDLQTVENIVPAMSKGAAAIHAIPEILNDTAATLDAEGLIALNRAVELGGKAASDLAVPFITKRGLDQLGQAAFPRPIIVGLGEQPEAQVLAHVYAEALRAAGAQVTLQPVGDRDSYLPQLIAGQIDVVPEYVGTLTEYLNRHVHGVKAIPVANSDLGATTRRLREIAAVAGIAIGVPSKASNTNSFAVTEAFAKQNGIETLSDLARVCDEVTLGGPLDCISLSFCGPALEEKYGIVMTGFMPLDAGGPLTKAALRRGDVILGLVFALDGTLRMA